MREYYCSKKLLYRDSSLVSVIDKRLIDSRNKSQDEFSVYHSIKQSTYSTGPVYIYVGRFKHTWS